MKQQNSGIVSGEMTALRLLAIISAMVILSGILCVLSPIWRNNISVHQGKIIDRKLEWTPHGIEHYVKIRGTDAVTSEIEEQWAWCTEPQYYYLKDGEDFTKQE